jgi:hypothetical protein
MKTEIQFCCDQHVQDVGTLSFLIIQFFTIKEVQNCTNLQGIGVRTFFYQKRYHQL